MSNLITKQICNGVEKLVLLPETTLMDFNNMMIENPLIDGLEYIDGKLYGIIATIRRR
jgi:hypothetical protein